MDHGSSLSTKGRIFRALESFTRGVIFRGVGVVPTLLTVSPGSGEQGSSPVITMTGTNLLNVIGIDFGPGIIIEAPSVHTQNTIVVVIHISSSAALTVRDVTVTAPMGSSTLVNAFEVVKVTVKPSGSAGGLGTLKGVAKHVLIRHTLDESLSIKVQKADGIEYDLELRIAKRFENDESLALGVSQTLSDALMLALGVDKPGADLATAQILQHIDSVELRETDIGVTDQQVQVVALSKNADNRYEIDSIVQQKKQAEFMSLSVIPQPGFNVELKETIIEVDRLPPPEAHTLGNEEEYNGIEGKLCYTGGDDYERV